MDIGGIYIEYFQIFSTAIIYRINDMGIYKRK